jgi:hypothetical protein
MKRLSNPMLAHDIPPAQRETPGRSDAAGTAVGHAVPRAALVAIIKQALADLHDRRRRVDVYPQGETLEEQIRSWEDVLEWLKDLSGPSVMLESPPALPY